MIKLLDSTIIHSFEKVEKINSGSFGKIYKVSKPFFYALKVMKVNVTYESIRQFLSEYEILNMLFHPNIVKTFGIFLGNEFDPPSILLEFCPSSLEEIVKKKMVTNV